VSKTSSRAFFDADIGTHLESKEPRLARTKKRANAVTAYYSMLIVSQEISLIFLYTRYTQGYAPLRVWHMVYAENPANACAGYV